METEDQKKFFDAVKVRDISTLELICSDEKISGNGGPVNVNAYMEQDNEYTALFYAARHADCLRVVEVICKSSSVNSVDVNKGHKNGTTPLAIAAARGNDEIVLFLCSFSGILLNALNDFGRSALSCAVAQKGEKVLKILCNKTEIDLNHENWLEETKQREMFDEPKLYPLVVRLALQKQQISDINKSNDQGDTLAHMAVISENKEALVDLSERDGINFNKVNLVGNTLLHLAVDVNNIDIVQFLTEKVGNIEMNVENKNGDTPLMLAEKGNNVTMVDIFKKSDSVSHGLNISNRSLSMDNFHSAVEAGNEEKVKNLLKLDDIEVNKSNANGDKPLHIAVKSGNRKILKILLDYDGIDVNTADKQGDIPLHLAVKKGNLDVVKCFMEHTKILECVHNVNKKKKTTVLHVAAKTKNVAIIKLICEKVEGNVFFVTKNENNQTAFEIMFPHQGFNVKEYLYKALVKLASKTPERIVYSRMDKQGYSILHMAVICGDLDSLRILCQRKNGNKHMSKSKNIGDKPLHLAENHLANTGDTTSNIINKGDDNECAPLLHKAIETHNYDIVKFLVEHNKINIIKKNANGDMPIHLVASIGTLDALTCIYMNHEHINEHINERNKDDNTPLHLAAKAGNFKIVEYLTKHTDIDINLVNKRGNTPLHLALYSQYQDTKVVECLSRFQGAKNIQNNNKDFPFRIVSKSENYPLNYLLLLYKLPGYKYKVNKRYRQGQHSLLHIAAKEEKTNFVKALLDENADIDTNVVDESGMTALHFSIMNNDLISVKHICSNKKTDINFMHSGKSPLAIAIEEKNCDIVWFLLTQTGINLEFKAGESNVFKMIKSLIQDYLNGSEINSTDSDILNQLLSTYLTDDMIVSSDMPETLEKILRNEQCPVLDFLRSNIQEGSTKSSPVAVKTICAAVLNVTITGLQLFANDDHLKFVFFKRSVFKTLVHIFVNLDVSRASDDIYLAQLFNYLYIGLQANIRCNCFNPFIQDQSNDGTEYIALENDGTSAVEKYLRESLSDALYSEFKQQIRKIVSNIDKSSLLSEVQLSAVNISKTYFKDERDGKCRKTVKWFGKNVGDCGSCVNKIYHKCLVRSNFAFILCFMGILFHIADIAFDVIFGKETLNGFSKELGIFIIVLVLVALIHENIRSTISVYIADSELLRTTLGKIEIEADDLKISDLNYYPEREKVFQYLGRFFWPYTVDWGISIKKKSSRAILFNILSILWLRPVVDRLIVLTHFPSNFRVIYRQKCKEKSLNQYYLVLEQLPELLLKFYVIQIYFNIFWSSEAFENSRCNITLSHNFNFDYNIKDFECVKSIDFTSLKICASWYQICSIIIPMIKMPYSIVCLEEMLRMLSPTTPKMSKAACGILYFAYVLMIPSRLFMFSAIMHSVSNNLYVIAYITFMSLIWMMVNIAVNKTGCRNNGNYQGFLNKFEFKKKETWEYIWSVFLFSLRDVFVISLRRPMAYLVSPSVVTYKSLRDWKEILIISIYFATEGFIGAWLIEKNYPCGRNSDVFKYQGWLFLILVIIATSWITLVSYVLQSEKMNIIPQQFLKSSVHISCSYGLLVSAFAVIFFLLTTTECSNKDFKSSIITCLIIVSLFLVIAVLILRCFGEAKDKKSDHDGTCCDAMPCHRGLCSEYLNCLCCRHRLAANAEIQLSPLRSRDGSFSTEVVADEFSPFLPRMQNDRNWQC